MLAKMQLRSFIFFLFLIFLLNFSATYAANFCMSRSCGGFGSGSGGNPHFAADCMNCGGDDGSGTGGSGVGGGFDSPGSLCGSAGGTLSSAGTSCTVGSGLGANTFNIFPQTYTRNDAPNYVGEKNVNSSAGGQNCGTALGGNPINFGTGTKIQKEVDMNLIGDMSLEFIRYYNSHNANFEQNSSTLSPGWSHSYSRRIEIEEMTFSTYKYYIIMVRDDGEVRRYTITEQGADNLVSSGAYASRYKIMPVKDSSNDIVAWEYHEFDNLVETYDLDGKLVSISNRWGQTINFDYSLDIIDGGDSNNQTLDIVSDSFGRTILLKYDPSGKLQYFHDVANNIFEYQYLSNNLVKIIYPKLSPTDTTNPEKIYHYSDVGYPHALTGITDEENKRVASWQYDDLGRVFTSSRGNNQELVMLNFIDDDTTVVTDSLGNINTYNFINKNGKKLIDTIDGNKGSETGDYKNIIYNDHGTPRKKFDFKGDEAEDYTISNTTGQYTYLEKEGRNDAVRVYYSSFINGEPYWKVYSDKLSQKYKEERITYFFSGPLKGKIDYVTVKDLKQTSREIRKTDYDYDTIHFKVDEVNGPRTDVDDITLYRYHTDGNLWQIENALGHVTTYSLYDDHGRPGKIVDPNGIETIIKYDSLGRTTSYKIDGKETKIDYYKNGKLKKETLPDNSFLEYKYDDAQRLTEILDILGNKIVLDLDEAGNIKHEYRYEPTGILRKSSTNQFNTLSQLEYKIDDSGNKVKYEYDENGNQDDIIFDPGDLNENISRKFDTAKRMYEQENPDTNIVSYDFDERNNVIGIIDAEDHETLYKYNGYDELEEVNSPVTGITTYRYDTAGNLILKTDSRDINIEYRYDELNRLKSVIYPEVNNSTNPLDITYTYDSCTYGIGKLCHISDASGTTSYTYDRQGNVKTSSTTIGIQTYLVVYDYDDANRVKKIEYPSGIAINYIRDAAGNIQDVTQEYLSSVSNLLTGAEYLPFGPLKSFTYGNNILHQRIYDLDYRYDKIISGSLQDIKYGYDPKNNINLITDNINPTLSQSFDYNNLNHLDFAQGVYGTIDYNYDANGSQTSLIIDISPNFNANTNNLKIDYLFDDNNRLSTVTDDKTGNILAEYSYNYRNLRAHKTTGSNSVRHYIYDLSGKLIYVADSNGNPVEQYVYIDEMPLAFISNSSTYYYHTDHLYTPQLLTDNQETIVWKANYMPYGKTDIAIQTVDNNLRFPGQYYDEETGLHYNWHRYYSAVLGRYITSDPLGLAGGLNTYGYAEQNPINNYDRDGLIACGGLCVVAVGVGAGLVFDATIDSIRGSDNSGMSTFANAAGGASVSSTLPLKKKNRSGAGGGGRSGDATSLASQQNHAAYRSGKRSLAARHLATGVLRRVPYFGLGLAAVELADAIRDRVTGCR